MSGAVKEAVSLMEALPERKALEKAEKDIAENGTISHDSINWN